MAQTIEADYLVIGAGAMGMAFTDTLISETDATVAIVDRYHQPGGHWNVAYPYVRLHQPSAFYGVNSRKLGSDTIDTAGWNKGLYELATNSEVCAYFDQVMQQQFVPSGRVQYLPMYDYQGDLKATSVASGDTVEFSAGKVVDATYMNVTVPSMRQPGYQVDDGVSCVPPNELARLQGEYQRYVIIGAGKTGMDACLFLLRNGDDPQNISWVMPRDSWLLDRANIQPGKLFADSLGKAFARQTEVFATAESVEDALVKVAEQGGLLRFDDDVWPTMYRCATVTQAELEQLRRISDIIRLGRVKRITVAEIQLDDGTYHPVDSSEMAFKQASRQAFKQAFLESKPSILEPIMNVEIETPNEFQGPVQGDLSSRRGILQGSDMRDGYTIIQAEVPLSEMFGYSTELRSMTQGKASFSMEFGRYRGVPSSIQEKLVAKFKEEQAKGNN